MNGNFVRLLAFAVLAAVIAVSSCNAYRQSGAQEPAVEAAE